MEKAVRKELETLAKLIEDKDKFAIATHIQPDGDGIGSVIGLGLLLKNLGKDIFLSWEGNGSSIPPQYGFLPGLELVKDPRDNILNFPHFISIDCPNIERLGALERYAKQAEVIVNIDHHTENQLFGQINVVDEEVSACAELIFDLTQILAVEIDTDVATCLYTGIVTDTGRFQYSNVSPHTFEVAKKLVEAGVNQNYVFQHVYEETPFNQIKLLGVLLSKAQLISGLGLVYSFIAQDDFAETKTSVKDTENLIDYLRAIKEARVAAVFKETPSGELRISLRSKGNIDVSRVAKHFGGGGHLNASGYSSQKKPQEALSDLIRVLEEGD